MTARIEYVLCRVVEGSRTRLEISQQERLSLQKADNQLNHALDVEEKYDVTIQNYLEFETSIIEEAVHDLVRARRSTVESKRSRQLLGRRLSNVLSSARLYVETLKHHSKEILTSDPIAFDRIEEAQREQYDKSLDYRLIEALRNYAQHHALPVHGLIGPASQDDRNLMNHGIVPYVDPDLLREDNNFKAQVLKELPIDGDVVTLKPVLRSYIESLGAIQKVFREQTETSLVAAFRCMLSARQRFVDRFPNEGTFALAAASIDEHDNYIGEISYIDAALKELQEYFGSEMVSMENFRHRRVEY